RFSSRYRLAFGLFWLLLVGMSSMVAFAQQKTAEEDATIAQSLAEMLRDARAIISNNQARINDPEIGDKGLSAKIVLDQAVQPYSEMTDAKGRPAYRVMVPEYYAASCLTCHGTPKGEMDITGYPKEGAKQDDLGGVISITLYR